jgi:hypothetical protein
LQTFVHFHASFSRICPSNVRWNEYEDTLLMDAVEKFTVSGVINWGKVGSALPARNKTQCYNRYVILSKSQNQKKGTFSRQEDRKILEYIARMGERAFKDMPSDFLPGRLCRSEITGENR